MRVAIYARVSTRDKEQNPEVQLDPLRRYSKDMGWEVYGEFVDKARATDFVGRKAWVELMKGVPMHRFDILLVWKLDRAFRSVQHCSNCVADLSAYHIQFRSYMDTSIDTTTPNGRLMMHILSDISEFEKDLDSQRIREGMDYAKEHGTKSGKPIGRARIEISDDDILSTLSLWDDNRTRAAQALSERYGMVITPGFVSIRAKRALQKAGQKTGIPAS